MQEVWSAGKGVIQAVSASMNSRGQWIHKWKSPGGSWSLAKFRREVKSGERVSWPQVSRRVGEARRAGRGRENEEEQAGRETRARWCFGKEREESISQQR